MDDSIRLSRLRRAYELGRLLRAVGGAWPALALGVIALAIGASPLASLGYTAALFVFLALAGWSHDGLQRGGQIGVWLGLGPIVATFIGRCGLHSCGSLGCSNLCLAVGLLIGAVIGQRLGRAILEDRTASFRVLLGGATGALIAIGLSCAPAGAGTLLGLMAGTLLVLVPTWIFARSQ